MNSKERIQNTNELIYKKNNFNFTNKQIEIIKTLYNSTIERFEMPRFGYNDDFNVTIDLVYLFTAVKPVKNSEVDLSDNPDHSEHIWLNLSELKNFILSGNTVERWTLAQLSLKNNNHHAQSFTAKVDNVSNLNDLRQYIDLIYKIQVKVDTPMAISKITKEKNGYSILFPAVFDKSIDFQLKDFQLKNIVKFLSDKDVNIKKFIDSIKEKV